MRPYSSRSLASSLGSARSSSFLPDRSCATAWCPCLPTSNPRNTATSSYPLSTSTSRPVPGLSQRADLPDQRAASLGIHVTVGLATNSAGPAPISDHPPPTGTSDNTSQVSTVAMLVTTGIVTAWCCGREFVDGTVAGLFAATVSRRRIAAAKFVVMIGWSLTACAATILLALLAGALLGLGPPTGDAWSAAGMDLAAGTLMAALALPLAWVASARRGYLPAVAALLLIVIATQIITALGAGGWFPYAAPALWVGMGGPEAAASIEPTQLLLALPVSAAGIRATTSWWNHAQLT